MTMSRTAMASNNPAKRAMSDQIGKLLQAALAEHRAGRLEEAKAGYEAVLAVAPAQADALQLLGVIMHQQGAQDEGIALLRQAAALQPKNPNIRNNLGGVLRNSGQLQEAEVELAAAIALAPEAAETYVNHGIILEQLQRFGEAQRAYVACLSRLPDHLQALQRLAAVLLRLGRHLEAEPYLRRLDKLRPEDAETLGHLAIAVQAQGRTAEAEDLFRAAIGRAGDKPALRSSLLSLLNSEPRDEAAREAFRQMLRENPQAWNMEIIVANRLLEAGRLAHGQQILDDILVVHHADPQAWNDAGAVLMNHGKYKESMVYYRRASELDPRMSAAYCNLGTAYLHTQRLTEAVAAYREALRRDPAGFQAQINMIRALRLLERFEEAHIFARSALDLMATAPNITAGVSESSALLLQFLKTVCDFDGLDQIGDVWAIGDSVQPRALPSVFLDQLVFAKTDADVQRFIGLVRKWATYVEGLAAQTPLAACIAEKTPRRLRIGVLSSDLRAHSVARFVMPIFEGYNRDKFEIHCYAPIRAEADPVQQKLRGLASAFTYIDGMTDREVAAAIRADDIDILLDLNGFTQHSRIAALAYKPAAVQMSWLGYPFTSGLKAIDYIIMDRFVAPTDESTLTEQPIIMPEAWICFGKMKDVPIDPVPPVLRNGVITFGTLNNPYKFNRENIALWADVMRQVPGSRFLLIRPEVASTTLVRHIAMEFAKNGISTDRLFVRNNRAEKQDYLSYYNEIDVSLDTYPVTGGTTTCDALWMGVPVIAMVGPAYHHRISAAILRHVGLDELCATTPDEFVARAVAVANDPERIAAWRVGLREAMMASPLCDERRFVHQFQEMLEQVAQAHGLR